MVKAEILAEILEDNLIVKIDTSLGIILTVNGSYTQLWSFDGRALYAIPRDKSFYDMTAAQLWDEVDAFDIGDNLDD